MKQYAIPCIISLLVGALYNIVDQIFIANASYLGSYGNAANTVVFPLTVVALAIAVMVGDGCCAFVSMALGRSEMDKAKRSVGNAVIMILVGSLVLTVVYLIFADGIIAMFGGTVNKETFHYSQELFREVVFGVGFALLLPIFFGLDGVLYSMPVSDALTFVISAIIIARTYRELNVESDTCK